MFKFTDKDKEEKVLSAIKTMSIYCKERKEKFKLYLKITDKENECKYNYECKDCDYQDSSCIVTEETECINCPFTTEYAGWQEMYSACEYCIDSLFT